MDYVQLIVWAFSLVQLSSGCKVSSDSTTPTDPKGGSLVVAAASAETTPESQQRLQESFDQASEIAEAILEADKPIDIFDAKIVAVTRGSEMAQAIETGFAAARAERQELALATLLAAKPQSLARAAVRGPESGDELDRESNPKRTSKQTSTCFALTTCGAESEIGGASADFLAAAATAATRAQNAFVLAAARVASTSSKAIGASAMESIASGLASINPVRHAAATKIFRGVVSTIWSNRKQFANTSPIINAALDAAYNSAVATVKRHPMIFVRAAGSWASEAGHQLLTAVRNGATGAVSSAAGAIQSGAGDALRYAQGRPVIAAAAAGGIAIAAVGSYYYRQEKVLPKPADDDGTAPALALATTDSQLVSAQADAALADFVEGQGNMAIIGTIDRHRLLAIYHGPILVGVFVLD